MKNNIFTKEFIVASLNRCLRTVCQTAISLITVGQAITELDWISILSVSATAGVVSLLTSIATGLPEASEKADGVDG